MSQSEAYHGLLNALNMMRAIAETNSRNNKCGSIRRGIEGRYSADIQRLIETYTINEHRHTEAAESIAEPQRVQSEDSV